MNSDNVVIQRVDYTDPEQGQALLQILDAYARDPMGGGEALPDTVGQNLLGLLQQTPHAISYIAYLAGKPVGLINGFESVSTFAARRLVNIHDLAVLPAARGRGVAGALLQAMEDFARERQCCKLTLEVLTGNETAAALYQRAGFHAYQLDPSQGQAVFLQKKLD